MSNPNVDPIAAILAEAEANRRRERAASANANTTSTAAATGDYTVDGQNLAGTPLILDANGKIPASVLYPSSTGGGQGTRTFEYVQSTPSTVWTIRHNLGGYIPPVVVGPEGAETPSVRYVDDNNVVLEFGHPKTGTARFSI